MLPVFRSRFFFLDYQMMRLISTVGGQTGNRFIDISGAVVILWSPGHVAHVARVDVLHGAVAAAQPAPAPAPALPRPGVLPHGDGRPEVILLCGVGAVLPLAGLGPPEAEAGVVARVGGLGAGVAVRVPATRLLSPGRPHRLQ